MFAPDDSTFIASKPYARGYVTRSGYRSAQKPWCLQEEIQRVAAPSKDWLDIGCGDAKKVAPLSHGFRSLTALDPSREMLDACRDVLTQNRVLNARVVQGYGERLPLSARSCDLVTSILSGAYVDEAHRVLRPGGWLVIESIGTRDQVNIKHEFGEDCLGARGQYLDHDSNAFEVYFREKLADRFEEIRITNGFWESWYSRAALRNILHHTPLVRGFDAVEDGDAFERLAKKYMTDLGIKTVQNRVLVVARKS